MPVLDPKRLLELLQIAEHGSYTGAAAARGVSQPALSNSIAILERSLGVQVLIRTRRGVALTDFGRILVDHAGSLDGILSRAARDVELRKQGREGSLVVGTSPLACAEIIPAAIVRLNSEADNVDIYIDERPDEELLDDLRTGEIDVVVGPTGVMADPPDVVRELLLRDTFYVIMRRGHRMAKLRSVSLAELHAEQWVMPNAQTTMWGQIEALFASENQPWPTNCIATNSITALKSLVMLSDFVALSSSSLVSLENRAGLVACVALRQKHFLRDICIRYKKSATLSPLVQRFIIALHASVNQRSDTSTRKKERRPFVVAERT